MIRGLNKNSRETIIGGAVLAVLALALWSNASDRKVRHQAGEGYTLVAAFDRTDGLNAGSEVRVAGIRVGEVVRQQLDERFRSHVTLRIQSAVHLPIDSAAVIETDGLLGSKYIELQPGGEEELIPPGGQISYTQSSLVIEDLLAKIVSMAHSRRAKAAAQQNGSNSGGVPAPTEQMTPLLQPDIPQQAPQPGATPTKDDEPQSTQLVPRGQ